jgi:hypothetical protein
MHEDRLLDGTGLEQPATQSQKSRFNTGSVNSAISRSIAARSPKLILA